MFVGCGTMRNPTANKPKRASPLEAARNRESTRSQIKDLLAESLRSLESHFSRFRPYVIHETKVHPKIHNGNPGFTTRRLRPGARLREERKTAPRPRANFQFGRKSIDLLGRGRLLRIQPALAKGIRFQHPPRPCPPFREFR